MTSTKVNYHLAILLFTIFIDILGFGILIPIIPILLASPDSPYFLLPAGMRLGQGYVLLGLLTATFPAMQFLAAPVLGRLSDRYGRKKILLLSLAGTCISYFIFGLGIVFKNIPVLFISRALDGLTGGVIAVAQASIADFTDPDRRVRNFGLLGAAFGLGFIGGPFLGGKLSDPSILSWFDAATPFWFSGTLSFLNVVSVLFLFPETRPPLTAGNRIKWGGAWQNLRNAFMHARLKIVFITSFIYQMGFSFFASFGGLFMIRRFGFNQGNIGDYFAFVGLCGIFSQAVVVRQVAKRYRARQTLNWSILCAGALVFISALTSRWWQFALLAPFFSVFTSLTQTNMTGLISSSADGHIQGEMLGINASVQALAMAFPPVVSGIAAAAIAPEAPMHISALFMLAAGLIFRIWYRTGEVKEVSKSA